MTNDHDKEATTIGRLDSLRDYILKLYALGGVPLVLIGVGAAVLLLGGVSERSLIAGVSICSFGIIAWIASAYIASIRWRIEMQIAAAQDTEIVKTVCAMVGKLDPQVIEQNTRALLGMLDKLGVRAIAGKQLEQNTSSRHGG